MFPTTTIPKLHNEYNNWVRELIFYKEEIKIFEKHLEEVINHFTAPPVKAKVEQFQNKFICHKEVIDELKHKLNVSERQLAGFVKELSGLGLDSIKMDNHVKLRDDMKTFRQLYQDLRKEFRCFESDCQ